MNVVDNRGVGAILIVTCFAGCQIVGGYESFEGVVAVDAGAPPHPCEVLPSVKVVEGGHGPNVARVNLAGTTCVWIDRTEVTVENYQEWLAFLGGRAPDWAMLGSEGQCTWKQGGPSNPSGDASDECRRGIEAQTERHEEEAFEAKKPIRCVDWCDARAYCAWAGKRLCFGVNNSGVLLPRGKPPEWDRACSVGSTREYPYGTAYDHAACNVDQDRKSVV